MSMSFFKRVLKIHSKFLRELYLASRFDEKPFTILPTILFSVGSFILTYLVIHRHTYPMTHIKLSIYRALGFHWSYFYAMRVWYLLLKTIRWSTYVLEERLKENKSPSGWVTPTLFHNCIFGLLLLLGCLPGLLAIVNYISKRNVPNFLMWMGEDPWLRTEIGLSGHYLDRPPNFDMPKRKDYSYRTHRSASEEYASSKVTALRKSKSFP